MCGFLAVFLLFAPICVFAQKQSSRPVQQVKLEVLSDTTDVDLGPYLLRVTNDVRKNWEVTMGAMPVPVKSKKGKVSIVFSVRPDGHVEAMRLIQPSGDAALDRSAWGGIRLSEPLLPLPSGYSGSQLTLRCNFDYDLDPEKE